MVTTTQENWDVCIGFELNFSYEENKHDVSNVLNRYDLALYLLVIFSLMSLLCGLFIWCFG